LRWTDLDTTGAIQQTLTRGAKPNCKNSGIWAFIYVSLKWASLVSKPGDEIVCQHRSKFMNPPPVAMKQTTTTSLRPRMNWNSPSQSHSTFEQYNSKSSLKLKDWKPNYAALRSNSKPESESPGPPPPKGKRRQFEKKLTTGAAPIVVLRGQIWIKTEKAQIETDFFPETEQEQIWKHEPPPERKQWTNKQILNEATPVTTRRHRKEPNLYRNIHVLRWITDTNTYKNNHANPLALQWPPGRKTTAKTTGRSGVCLRVATRTQRIQSCHQLLEATSWI